MAAANLILAVYVSKFFRERCQLAEAGALRFEDPSEVVPWGLILRCKPDGGLGVGDFSLDDGRVDGLEPCPVALLPALVAATGHLDDAVDGRVHDAPENQEPAVVPGAVVTHVISQE